MTEFLRVRRRTANYKSCFFRNCGNTTICASEKIFIPVPKGEVRKHWIQIVRGDDKREFSLKSSLYCCEDHFDLQEDLENYTRLLLDPTANVRLKKGVLPKPCTIDHTRSNIFIESTEEVNFQDQFTSDDTADMIFDEAEQKPNIESIQLYRSIGIQTDYIMDETLTNRRDIGTQTENSSLAVNCYRSRSFPDSSNLPSNCYLENWFFRIRRTFTVADLVFVILGPVDIPSERSGHNFEDTTLDLAM